MDTIYLALVLQVSIITFFLIYKGISIKEDI